jgi:hypothetical protein
MKPFRISIIIGFLALVSSLEAGSTPEGDQHAASLTKSLNQVVSASALVEQGIKDSKPSEEILHALSVFADVWDELCARYTQFLVWADLYNREKPGSAAAQFSAPGLVQIRKFLSDYQEFTKSFGFLAPQYDTAMIQYERDDARITQEKNRVFSSMHTMEAVLNKAGVQWTKKNGG